MSDMDPQEPNGSGKHRGDSAGAEDPASTTTAPHGRHRREPDAR
ncbi:hypothetical protein [Streptomyces sp. NPDC048659]